jgi:hypothetical protein
LNFDGAEKIATAILYEGYILYPYRPTSVKNRQRWNFGTLYPRVYAEAQRPPESFRLVAECIAIADESAALDVKISFLQLIRQGRRPDRKGQAGELTDQLTDPSLAWEEAVEQTLEQSQIRIQNLFANPIELMLKIDSSALPKDHSSSANTTLEVVLKIRAEQAGARGCKLHVEIENATPLSSGAASRRDEALPQSFVSTHVLLGITGGEFVSMLDPQQTHVKAVAECENMGVFPVLVGTAPERSMMLCSPIILYDYPQIAPESEGDFFDGTEMDEMLTLRVLTLTDSEKQQMREGDSRTRKILERTENLTPEMMLKAHGVVRSMREIRENAVPKDTPFTAWNPFEETKAPPESVTVFGVPLRVGDRVRLWPQKTADIMDLALKGKVAVIEAIEQDFEDQIQFAVVLDDDPGREFGMMRQPGHRFFYSPEEVEPVTEGEPA